MVMRDPAGALPVMIAHGIEHRNTKMESRVLDPYFQIIMPIMRKSNILWRSLLPNIIPWLEEQRVSRCTSHISHVGAAVDRDENFEHNSVDLEAADLYLHIIVSDGLSSKKQIPVNVTQLPTDYRFSVELNRIYRIHRGC
jgi:hypothetical protein